MIRLHAGHCALFASDVHLGDHDPATGDAFLEALDRHCPDATHLFLLGDLFEAWVGDDWCDTVSREAITRLAALSARGTRVFVMRGNRDFLLDAPMDGRGKGFAAATRATMLDDPTTIDLFGTRTLLTHGDALCTDDADYQRFRTLIRSADWQQSFLRKPLAERIAIGQDLRARSELSKGEKASYVMDVNTDAVRAAMADAGVSLMIHGHTHRPARHALGMSERPAVRWVLPDWDAHAGRGGMLRATADGLVSVGDWSGALEVATG